MASTGTHEIRYLADRPDAIPLVARWLHDEWGRFRPGASVERSMASLEKQARRDGMPLALLAVDGDAVVGTASLVEHDMDTRRDLSPWLASVYVAAARRRRGVGTALVDAIVQESKRAGLENLFLFTDSEEAWYGGLGWQWVEACVYQGRRVVIMTRRTA